MRDKALFFGWVTGLLLLISLLWILTTPLQASYLMRSANYVLTSNGDSRYLLAHIKDKSTKAGLLGYWFSIQYSDDKMFIFGAFQDGVLIPLGAVVAQTGEVREILPLSAHAVQVFGDLPDSIVKMYTDRIEGKTQ
ncbi:MAG: hypothetical protein FWC01_01220 [Treponema sp.]|nr:hypothetical protein [Treponema sp.]MCL2236767.1 hypothetical protein [Treponema sp.]